MKVIATLYAGYMALMLAAFAIDWAFGATDCFLDCEQTQEALNWADYALLVYFVLAVFSTPVTVGSVVAFLVAALVAVGRRGKAVARDMLVTGVVIAVAALPVAWIWLGT